MAYTIAPIDQRQYFDNNGVVLSGGKIYTYLSGTSTPAVTYSDAIGTPNTFPIVLDAAGRCRIYLDVLAYKFLVTDSNGVPVGLPMDPVTATTVGASGIGEIFVFGGASDSPITGTSYPSGVTFDKLHPGTAVFSEDSVNLTGTYKLQVTGLQDTAGTLTVALVNLSDGAPDTPIATATVTSATGAVATSAAIAWGGSGSTKQYGIKVKVSANTGFAWGARILRTA